MEGTGVDTRCCRCQTLSLRDCCDPCRNSFSVVLAAECVTFPWDDSKRLMLRGNLVALDMRPEERDSPSMQKILKVIIEKGEELLKFNSLTADRLKEQVEMHDAIVDALEELDEQEQAQVPSVTDDGTCGSCHVQMDAGDLLAAQRVKLCTPCFKKNSIAFHGSDPLLLEHCLLPGWRTTLGEDGQLESRIAVCKVSGTLREDLMDRNFNVTEMLRTEMRKAGAKLIRLDEALRRLAKRGLVDARNLYLSQNKLYTGSV
jgi:hypothetical protein